MTQHTLDEIPREHRYQGVGKHRYVESDADKHSFQSLLDLQAVLMPTLLKE